MGRRGDTERERASVGLRVSLSPPLPLSPSSSLRVSPSPRLRVLLLLASIVLAGEPCAGAEYRGKSVSQWAGELDSQDLAVRWYATYALGRIGPGAVEALPALQRVLSNLDEHEYVRGGAAWALGRMGPKAAPAVPLLVRTLASKLVSVRRNAAAALGNLLAAQLPSPVSGEVPGVRGRDTQDPKSSPDRPSKPQTTPAVSALQRLLNDEDHSVRVSAAVALWKIQRHPKATLALEAMLRGGDTSAAWAAAGALGDLGDRALEAVPALAAALGHADDDTRRAAAAALGRIGPGAIASLRGVLEKGDPRTRGEAVEGLGGIGVAATSPLIEAVGDSSPLVRRAAARALGRLGPAAKDAVPALLRAVSDPQPEVRETAAAALRQIRGS